MAEKEYMTMGEITKSLGITRRIILNYEEKGLIEPDVKNTKTSNRYYTADNITRIRSIRQLQNLGLSLDEIKNYFGGKTDLYPLIKRMEEMRDNLNISIEKLKKRVKRHNENEISTVILPKQTVYRKTLRSQTVEEKKEHLRTVIPEAVRVYTIDSTKRFYFIEYPIDDVENVTYNISVMPESVGESIANLPLQKSLCIYYHGSYDNIPEIRDCLVEYAKKNNIPILGTCRHIYLEGPPQHNDENKFITQVALPIEE